MHLYSNLHGMLAFHSQFTSLLPNYRGVKLIIKKISLQEDITFVQIKWSPTY